MDVSGYNPGGSDYSALSPRRFLETRPGKGTYDSRDAGVGRVGAGKTYKLDVAGRSGVASDASAVMVNVTAVRPSGRGYVTAYPCGGSVPNASTLNYAPGEVVANALTVPVGSNGQVCFFTSAETDLLVDVSGYNPVN